MTFFQVLISFLWLFSSPFLHFQEQFQPLSISILGSSSSPLGALHSLQLHPGSSCHGEGEMQIRGESFQESSPAAVLSHPVRSKTF